MSYTTGIYWLTRLDNINNLFILTTIIGAVLMVGYYMMYGIVYADDISFKEYNNKFKYTKRWALTLLIVGILGKTFIPSTKEMTFIIAGGKTMEYASKDTSLQKIPGQLINTSTVWLDNKLSEIKNDLLQNKKDSIK